MTKREKTRIRKRLEAKLADLNGLISQRGELIAERWNDPMDQIQSRQDLDLTVRKLDTSWQTKKSVQAALRKLETGEYGVCQDCGDPINPKRLEAIPWTTMCVSCQESYDANGDHGREPDFKRAA